MADQTDFPGYLTLESRVDPTTKTKFLSEIDAILDSADRKMADFAASAQRNLDAALSINRNSVGSLDLNVPELRAEAAAQEARALAARELYQAQLLVTKGSQSVSQQTRIEIAAAKALWQEHERAAQAARARASSAEQLQVALNREASATNMVVEAQRRGTSSSGAVINSVRAQRVAFTQFGQQLTDVGVQLQSGTSPFTILVQQAPQAGFALSGLKDSSNKFYSALGAVGAFISGPWGGMIAIGVAVLGPLVARILATSDALDEEMGKLKKNAEQTEAARKAKLLFAKSEEGVRKAILDQKEALDEQSRSLESAAEKALIAARSNLTHEISIRNTTKALLDQAIAQQAILDQARRVPGGTNDATATIDADRAAKADDLRTKLGVQEALIVTAQKNLERAQSFVSIEAGARNADPLERVRRQYEGPNGLIEQARRRAVAEGKVGDALERQVTALKLQEQVALDAAKEEKRQGSSSANREYGREIGLSEAASIARGAGFRITSGLRSFTKQKSLYDDWVAQGRPSDNPVAVPGSSAHERGNALDIAFGAGVTPASIKKAFQEEGVKLTKIFKERGHFHVEWSTTGADKVRREAEQIDDFGERAIEKVQRITEQFDMQPRAIDRAAAATRELDQITEELSKKKILSPETVALIEQARTAIADFQVRPFAEITRDSERQLEIQSLMIEGRDKEAAALQEIWRLQESIGFKTQEEVDYVRQVVIAREEEVERLRRIQEAQSAYLDMTKQVRSELEGILSGQFKLSGFKNIFKQLQGRVLFDSIFGEAFDQLDKSIKKGTPLGRATDDLVDATGDAGTALTKFADTVNKAAEKLSDPFGGAATTAPETLEQAFDKAFASRIGANDNGLAPLTAAVAQVKDIVVSGRRPNDPYATFEKTIMTAVRTAAGALDQKMNTTLFSRMAPVVGEAIYGYGVGGVPGGVLGALKGIKGLPEGIDRLTKSTGALDNLIKGSGTGSTVAGLGKALGIKMSTTGSQVGGAIGAATGIPGGDIIGSIIGGIVGGMLKSAKTGKAMIGAINGELGISGTGGNTKSYIKAASGQADAVLSGVQGIADALGATVNAAMGNVTIGVRDGKWRVNTSGTSLKKSGGAQDFGKDGAAAAAEAATLDLLRDGVLQGIRATTQRILASGKDLETALKQATDFESVFEQLKQIKDPVGAALDTLDKTFARYRKIFIDNAATAEETASLEELYANKRADTIKQARDAIAGPLQALLDDLTTGDNGLSLRDRIASAKAIYDPLAARVKAGDTTAFSDFANAGQGLLGLMREMFGSQSDYFDFLNELKSVTKSALDATTATADAAASRDSPFSTASSSASDNVAVVDAISAQTGTLSGQLAAVNQNLGNIAALLARNDNTFNPIDYTGTF